jgi:hypothetical protein
MTSASILFEGFDQKFYVDSDGSELKEPLALLLHFNAQNLEARLNKLITLLIEWKFLLEELSENKKNNKNPKFVENSSRIKGKLSKNEEEQNKLFAGGSILKYLQLEIVPEEWHKHTDYTYLVNKNRDSIKIICNYEKTEENQTVSEILA